MSIIKSLSVSEGDMYYIRHGSDNFSIIDCNIIDERSDEIIDEIKEQSRDKNIVRFISTHPDEDHMYGLDLLDNAISIRNFYCVKNKAIKEDETDAFIRYCQLRDSEKAFYLSKGCKRRWMNQTDEVRGSAGINILWPDLENITFKDELAKAANGESPNNICPIITYNTGNVDFVWMGDLETNYLDIIKDEINLNEITVLFAPHHGRKSGRIPTDFLDKLNPKVIIIGEAPAEDIHYYSSYNTITQNSAGDILFDVDGEEIDIYVGNDTYSVDFLTNKGRTRFPNYIGTIS